MPTIDELSQQTSADDNDKIAIFSQANRSTRSLTIAALTEVVGEKLEADITQAVDAFADTLATVNGAGLVGCSQNGTGAVMRTLQDRARDVISVRDFISSAIDGTTSNQVGLVAAVASAYATGAVLDWPVGIYVSTDSIPYLHAVRHRGPGVIKRGTLLFYPDPKEGQTNTLYIATTGNDLNDGLSAAQPIKGFQRFFDALLNYGPLLRGTWQLSAAAGTYTSTATATLDRLRSTNRVAIKGPAAGHPNVPTCIIDGGGAGANYQHGFFIKGDGLMVTVQDIKFQNFTGDPAASTRGALVFDDGCDAYTNNVHVDGASWFGIYGSRRTSGRQQGGIIKNCRNGVLTDGAKWTVGYGSTSLAMGTVIQSCTESGIYWCRNTDGHTDYVSLLDNAVGLYVDSNSRTDSVGCDFRRNTVAVRTANNGLFGNNPYTPCNLNIGTADANGTTFQYHAHSGETLEGATNDSEIRFACDRTFRTVSGIVSGTFPSICTIPASRLQGAGKSLRMVIYGTYTVTAGSTITVNLGGMTLALVVPAAATNAPFTVEVSLHDIQGGYRAWGKLAHNLSSPRLANASSGFSANADQAISIAYSLAGSGDSLNIYRTDVYLIG